VFLKDKSVELINQNSHWIVDPTNGNQPRQGILCGEEVIFPFQPDGGFFHSGNYLLFPWVNRLIPVPENWKLEGKIQYLDESTGIHGLLHQEPRQILSQTINSATFCMEILGIHVTESLILNQDTFRTEVLLRNTTKHEFLFSIGYHPYFQIIDWKDPEIEFLGETWNWELDSQLLPVKKPNKTKRKTLSLKDKWDHLFWAPDGLELRGKGIKSRYISSNMSFFQIYTPDSLQSVAIEPMLTPGNFLNLDREIPVLSDHQKKYWWEVKILEK
jgi:galactose mutarotase-like enzyme